MANLGDWLPGSKEAKLRAEAVTRRRNQIAAQTADLNLELEDLKMTLQLQQKDFKPADLTKFQAAFNRAQQIASEIDRDLLFMSSQVVPERINELQAQEYMQPALRIEARIPEVMKQLEKARAARQEAGKPREEADQNLATAEQMRLKAEIDLVACRQIAEELKSAMAETYPQVQAALQTAESEVLAATQMVTSSRLALARQAWREANDLSRRAATIFDSAAAKFQLIQMSRVDFAQAARDADDEVAAALNQLNSARTVLQGQAALLAHDPNFYLSLAVQRLGEARRAEKANPPQHLTALKLAQEARKLIDQGQAQALDEIYKIKNGRQEAHQVLLSLNQAVQDLRFNINSQRTVPVKANELYAKARSERDRLLPREAEVDKLALPQLVELTTAAKLALQTAQEGLKLLGQ